MRTALANAGHVQEGKNRFKKADPEGTLFTSAEDQKAELALFHKLEFFPTPPWATRAIIELMKANNGGLLPFLEAQCKRPLILDPACGRGHLLVPLSEYGYGVRGTDIHDYGKGYQVVDFLGDYSGSFRVLFMNPPFSLAEEFILKGLSMARDVMCLARLSLLCSQGRYDLHTRHLEAVYPFCDRVCMSLGKYDPKAKFATEIAWFHFTRHPSHPGRAPTIHIPPGARLNYFRQSDLLI
jgi:SAM-dependent methyltransferase